MPRVVIVGAGISGLSVAFRLRQLSPHTEIVVLEQADRPGGTMWTLRQSGFQIETGPNGFLDTKPTTLDLCRDLGLSERLVEASDAANKNRFLFLDGKLQPLPGGLGGLLRTRLLSWRGKLRLLTERFRRPLPQAMDESIAAFAQRRVGPEVAAVFGDALVTGIYAGDPQLLSLPACFPRLAEMEREHGSVTKGFAAAARHRRLEAQKLGQPYQRPGKMWSFRDGLRVLVEALRDRLEKAVVFGVPVRRLTRQQSTWTVHGDGQDHWTSDAVVLACPAHQQAGLLGDLDAELAGRVGEIPYNRLAVVALGFRRQDIGMPLDGFGFIAPQRTRRDLLGVQWCSSIFPQRAPNDMVLLRAMCGGWQRPEIVDWDDARLLGSVRAELRLAMGIAAAPVFHEIIRWHRAIPQYHVGHLERVVWLDRHIARHPGLFLAGNAYRGVSINDCTEQGAMVALNARNYLESCAG